MISKRNNSRQTIVRAGRAQKSQKQKIDIREHLVYIAAGLSFLSLIGYMVTRDTHLLDAAFNSPLSIVFGYYLGSKRKGN